MPGICESIMGVLNHVNRESIMGVLNHVNRESIMGVLNHLNHRTLGKTKAGMVLTARVGRNPYQRSVY